MKRKFNFLVLCMLMLAAPLSACAYAYEPETSQGEMQETSVTRQLSLETRQVSETTLGQIPHGELAMAHIIHMDTYLYRRPSFTYRELETAMWIRETLLDIGFLEGAIEIQEFSLADVAGRLGGPYAQFFDRAVSRGMFADRAPRRYSQNVILTIPGQSEQTIIIGAHYDTDGSGWGHGASDNASGVALLLESAQRMREVDNYYTLVYVFFGAEELATGLLGSYHYFNTLSQSQRDNILFMFNADVLFEGPYLIYVAGVLENGVRVDNALTDRWSALAAEVGRQHGLEFISYPRGMGFFTSDHIIFFEGGIPVLFFAGLIPTDEGSFWGRFLDTPYDNLAHIEATSPGLAQRNMQAFSILLETILFEGVDERADFPYLLAKKERMLQEQMAVILERFERMSKR